VGRRRHSGVTLIELMVVIGLMSVVLALAVPGFSAWFANQRAKSTARSIADALLLARAESIRTGHRHIVYFGNPGATDPAGNAVEYLGQWVPLLVTDDGTPVASNCEIDAGESTTSVAPVDGLSWGVSEASAAVPTDSGHAPFNPAPPWDGATFADATSTKVNWVMFQPDGIPVTFTGAGGTCGALGSVGSGAGAFYLTNGKRDYAVVLSPLGGVRVHVWNGGTHAWSG
jgi:prepilin-type N-terminal cleavage/methylation domain-containing protein